MSSPRTSRRATVASSPPDQVIQLKIMTTFVEPSNPEIPIQGPSVSPAQAADLAPSVPTGSILKRISLQTKAWLMSPKRKNYVI